MQNAPEGVLEPTIFETLRELLDADTLASTYREFLAQVRQRLSGWPSDGDRSALHDLGHTLRGTAGMLGADAVAACAGELERDGNAPHQPIFESILRACSELETALREAKVAL